MAQYILSLYYFVLSFLFECGLHCPPIFHLFLFYLRLCSVSCGMTPECSGHICGTPNMSAVSLCCVGPLCCASDLHYFHPAHHLSYAFLSNTFFELFYTNKRILFVFSFLFFVPRSSLHHTKILVFANFLFFFIHLCEYVCVGCLNIILNLFVIFLSRN